MLRPRIGNVLVFFSHYFHLIQEKPLPKHITKVSISSYWKKDGKRELRIVVGSDCYKIDCGYPYLPEYYGKLR